MTSQNQPKFRHRVLFVCLGNICRSPAAEGIFRHLVQSAGLHEHILIDSCGTGAWHVGDAPDGRMIRHAKDRGYDLSDLEARQFRAPEDFLEFDLILTMDEKNLQNVLALDRDQKYKHKVKPLVSFCKIHAVKEVPDPYYREADGFEYVLDLIEDAAQELLNHLKDKKP